MERHKVTLVDALLQDPNSLPGLLLRSPGLGRTLQRSCAAALCPDRRKPSPPQPVPGESITQLPAWPLSARPWLRAADRTALQPLQDGAGSIQEQVGMQHLTPQGSPFTPAEYPGSK